MPNFVQTTDNGPVTFRLGNNEIGVIGRNATVTNFNGLGFSVIDSVIATQTFGGRASVVIEGAVIGNFLPVSVRGAEVRISATGSVISTGGGAAIYNTEQSINNALVEIPMLLLNNGLISGTFDGVDSTRVVSGSVVNNGTIRGELNNGLSYIGISAAATNTLSVVNDGQISGGFRGIAAGTDVRQLNLTVVNTGEIMGAQVGILAASTAAGAVTITNSGLIRGPLFALELRASADTVINTGEIHGLISLGEGNDRLDSSQGLIFGRVEGGGGNDTLIGGDTDNEFVGGEGDDTITGGGGADHLLGGNGTDRLVFDAEDLQRGQVLGGSGFDTAVYTDDSTPITFILSNHEVETYIGSAANETILAGSGGAGVGVSLGAGADVFVGTNFSDVAAGGAGMDVLYGLGGADTLIGGDGADWLQGGSDADWFSYDFLSESTVNAQDFIADFSSAEGDKINLNAALSNAGFATATFNTGYGTGASVYAFNQGSFSLVQVYTGATLQMQMVVSQASLAVTDFIL